MKLEKWTHLAAFSKKEKGRKMAPKNITGPFLMVPPKLPGSLWSSGIGIFHIPSRLKRAWIESNWREVDRRAIMREMLCSHGVLTTLLLRIHMDPWEVCRYMFWMCVWCLGVEGSPNKNERVKATTYTGVETSTNTSHGCPEPPWTSLGGLEYQDSAALPHPTLPQAVPETQ